MKNPKFELIKRSSQFYFHLKAGNGKITLSSEGYASKQACQDGIASVRRYSPYEGQYERKHNNASYTFNLKGGNGLVIGRSESYISVAGREQGIESVMSDAPSAPIEDLT